jgi:hypothetical protein
MMTNVAKVARGEMVCVLDPSQPVSCKAAKEGQFHIQPSINRKTSSFRAFFESFNSLIRNF